MPTERTQRFFEQLSQKFPKAETDEEKRKRAEAMAAAVKREAGTESSQAAPVDSSTTPYERFNEYVRKKREKAYGQ